MEHGYSPFSDGDSEPWRVGDVEDDHDDNDENNGEEWEDKEDDY